MQFTKWIKEIDPEAPVHGVAARSIEARLAAVQHYLPLAARNAKRDVEYVHQLRVFTRRSMSALRLYEDLLPPEEARWVRKRLKEIRRAAGMARDMDVMWEKHRHESGKNARRLRDDIRRRRRKAQHPIVEIHRRLKRNDRFSRHVRELVEAIREQSVDDSTAFRCWARRKLAAIVEGFLAASPAPEDDIDQLHQFRIHGKHLRYAMELLAPAFPREFRRELYPLVVDLQERLGEVHDLAVAAPRLERWTREARSRGKRKRARYLKKLQKQSQKELEVRLAGFREWWTPEREADLRDAFARMCECPEPTTRGSFR